MAPARWRRAGGRAGGSVTRPSAPDAGNLQPHSIGRLERIERTGGVADGLQVGQHGSHSAHSAR